MADSTIWDLSAESAMLAAHRIPVQDTGTGTAAQHATFSLLGGMEVTTGGDEATAMAVGKLYRVDMSAWATAVRIYSLPTTAKVGERIGVYVTAGNATHEIAIRTTSASNDTINGVDYDSADWSKLFITGEIVIFECVVANSAWIVLHDGRKPCHCQMVVATSVSTNTANVAKQVDLDDTPDFDVGDIAQEGATDGEVLVRRAGKFYVLGQTRPQNALQDTKNYSAQIYISNSQVMSTFLRGTTSSTLVMVLTSIMVDVSDGDTIELWFSAEEQDMGYRTGAERVLLSALEILVP